MSELKINKRGAAVRGRRQGRMGAARLLIATAAVAALASPGQAQKVTSSIYGDDEFKVFISTDQAAEGVEFAQGAGWAVNFQNHLYLYGGSTSYYLHVWVRDIGGGPTGFLGQFRLTNHRGCRFANGTTTLLTGANAYWRVSARQAQSTPIIGGPIASVPYFNNKIPRYAPATLAPSDLGANMPGSANGWPSAPVPKPFAGVSPLAHWIGSSSSDTGSGPEMWFTTRIKCQTANLGANVNPN